MLEIIAIIGIFLFSYILVMRNFSLALYVLLIISVLMHKELFSFYRWDLLPVRAFMLAVMVGGITRVAKLINGKKISKKDLIKYLKQPFVLILILIWLIRGISIIFTKNLQSSVFLFGFFTTIVVLGLYLFKFLKKSPEKTLKYLKFYIYIVFGLSLFGYFQYFLLSQFGLTIGALWSIPDNIPRIGATFWDVNHYGALIAALLPLLGVLFLVEKGWKTRILYFLIGVSIFTALLLTNSRTAWIIDLVAFISFLTILLVRKYGAKGILAILTGLIIITVPFVIEYNDKASPFRAKVKHYFHYRMDSFDSHFMLLTGTVQIFEKYPVLGGGYGGFFEHFSKTRIAPTYFGRDPAALNTRVPAHTIWGETLAETGILGFNAFFVFILLILGYLLFAAFTFKEKKEVLLTTAMSSVLIGWMVAGIFYSYNAEFFWIILFMFFVYAYGLLYQKADFSRIIEFFMSKTRFVLWSLLIISATLIFVNIGKNHLIPWDEAIYAKISKNMVQSNEFNNMYWKPEEIWFEKPPLFLWIMAGFMKILGFTSLAARFASAVFGIGTVYLVYLFGKRMFNRTAGFIAGFSLVTTVHFLYYSRAAMLDVTATFFIVLSLYLYYLAKENHKIVVFPRLVKIFPFLFKENCLFIYAGAAIGFAVMTKGVIGLLVFPVIVIYEIFLFLSKNQKFSKDLLKQYLLLIGTSVLVFSPWHLEMIRRHGISFINGYLGYHVLSRAIEGIEEKGKPFYWYFIVMKVSMRIWFVALLAGIPVYLYQLFLKNKKYVFLSVWSLFVLLFFSAAKSKVVWYILPIYPALSLLVGVFIERALNFIMERSTALNNRAFKLLALYLLTVFGLVYLFFNKELVYTSDLTGSQARLLMLKDEKFGVETQVFIDRMELPLVLFYTDGPFKISDIHPEKLGRFPEVEYEKTLILLTKTGRFRRQVIGYDFDSEIVQEDGDYILWYLPAKKEVYEKQLSGVRENITEAETAIVSKYGNISNAPIGTQQEYNDLKTKEEEILQKIKISSAKQVR